MAKRDRSGSKPVGARWGWRRTPSPRSKAAPLKAVVKAAGRAAAGRHSEDEAAPAGAGVPRKDGKMTSRTPAAGGVGEARRREQTPLGEEVSSRPRLDR